VFSPENDEILFCDDIRGIIREGEELNIQEPMDLLSRVDLEAKWIILYRTDIGTIHTIKTPYIQGRELYKKEPYEESEQFADGLEVGSNKTFVFPEEVHGIIKQEVGV
jgi:hypothetical protein